MSRISFVVAQDRNRVIGKDGAIPWRAPSEQQWFKKITLGKPVVMGRRTFASLRRPLRDRTNIVVTRNPEFRPEGCLVAGSVDEALRHAGDAPEVMIIGGAEIYTVLLPRADRIYLTDIDAEFAGDTYFPALDPKQWRVVEERVHEPADDDPTRYRTRILDRIRG